MAPSFENISDEELVQRICQGCEESLLHLVVDRCGGMLRCVAKSYRYDGDLEHDVCVHLFGSGNWSRLRSWQGKASLEPWVRAVAIRICLNQCRARTKYQGRFQRLTEADAPATEAAANPGERRVELEATRSQLLQTIEKLSERDRMVILLHCLGDPQLSIEDLANQLNVNVNAVRTIKTRALQRLRRLLIDEGTDDV